MFVELPGDFVEDFYLILNVVAHPGERHQSLNFGKIMLLHLKIILKTANSIFLHFHTVPKFGMINFENRLFSYEVYSFWKSEFDRNFNDLLHCDHYSARDLTFNFILK